jgi:hypothetical protein
VTIRDQSKRERPILFSAPMVRAILDGRKTQTRRVVRRQFAADAVVAEVGATTPEGWQVSGHSGLWWDDAGACIDDAIRCPYGMPGDRLWVRETHAIVPRTAYARSEGVQQVLRPDDDHDAAIFREGLDRSGNPGWRPSIHMPRWASRITLEVTGVRVERLQAITEADARAEGIEKAYVDAAGRQRWKVYPHDDGVPREEVVRYIGPTHTLHAVRSFESLWLSINGPGSWRANPWVWVVEFRRAEAAC